MGLVLRITACVNKKIDFQVGCIIRNRDYQRLPAITVNIQPSLVGIVMDLHRKLQKSMQLSIPASRSFGSSAGSSARSATVSPIAGVALS